MKAKRSTRKREHALNDKSENGVCLLQKKYVGVQPFIAANKKKKNESENKDAPRKTHST
jgi:hypothetical protein